MVSFRVIQAKLGIWFSLKMVKYVFKKLNQKEIINPLNKQIMKKILNKKTATWSAVIALLIPALIKILEWLNEYLLTIA